MPRTAAADRSRSCVTAWCSATTRRSAVNSPNRPSTGDRSTSYSGAGFAIVVDDSSLVDDLDPRWAELAQIVELPLGSIPLTLPAGGAVIVRPDRYVAAVAHDAAELDDREHRTARTPLHTIDRKAIHVNWDPQQSMVGAPS